MPSRSSRIIYTVVNSKLATYVQIRDELSFEEVITLYEMILVSGFNKNSLIESLKSSR